jgi:hypothetical protein
MYSRRIRSGIALVLAALVTQGVAFDSAVTAGQNTTVLIARVASICLGGSW